MGAYRRPFAMASNFSVMLEAVCEGGGGWVNELGGWEAMGGMECGC